MKHQGKQNVWFPAAAMLLMLFLGMMVSGGCKKQGQGEGHAGIPWQTDYETASANAKTQQKPMLLAFHAGWCGPCNKMKKETYPDPAVVKAAEAFVPVMIDVDKQPKLAEQYQASSIPKYVIVKPDGSAAASLLGYMPPDEFAEKLREAAAP